MSQDAYAVEGYGERTPEYDGPYLDGHRLDPNVQFAFAGDPEKQAQLQKILDETEGSPVLANGVVTVKTGPGEPNVVIHTKEADEVKTIVLERTKVDEINDENREAELAGPPELDDQGNVVEPEGDDKVNLDGASGKDETRDGAPYNPTDQGSRADEGTNQAGVEQSLKTGPQPVGQDPRIASADNDNHDENKSNVSLG